MRRISTHPVQAELRISATILWMRTARQGCSDRARIGVPREDAFSGISVDKTDYSADGESAQVEIKLDTGFSQWVEQDGGLDQIRISADGGVTLSEVDWKSGQTAYPAERHTDGNGTAAGQYSDFGDVCPH